MKKAILLAGGRGTRLYPLTDTMPKPLIPLLGKPVICHILDLLCRNGFEEVLISAMYRAEDIIGEIGKSYGTLGIRYYRETEPLGTAGCLPYARELLSIGDDEDFLVIAGDCVCSFDLASASRFHAEKKAELTVITCPCDDPLEYGLVLSDSDGRIRGFNEKPPWSQVTGCYVNTGVYLLSGKVIDRIPRKAYDFSSELFPQMLNDNCRLYEYRENGYWCDIGDVGAYYACSLDALHGSIPRLQSAGNADRAPLTARGIRVREPCYIACDAEIGDGALIGPDTVIGHGCHIAEGSLVSGSILHDGVFVGKDTAIRNSIIGESASLLEGCLIGEGCVIGARAVVNERHALSDGSVLGYEECRGFEDEKGAAGTVFRRLPHLVFTDHGILLGDETERDFSQAVLLGSSLARITDEDDTVGVMFEGAACYYPASAICCGLGENGRKVLDCGEGFHELSHFVCSALGLRFMVFLRIYDHHLYAEITGGAPWGLSHEEERKLDAACRHVQKPCAFPMLPSVFSGSRYLYENELKNAVHAILGRGVCFDGLYLAIASERKANGITLFGDVFTGLGGTVITRREAEEHAYPILSFSEDGVRGITQGNYTLDRYHMTAYVLEHDRRCGKTAFILPYLSPAGYRKILDEHCDISRYPMERSRNAMYNTRISSDTLWLRDGYLLCMRFLALIFAEKKNLSEVLASLPRFSVAETQLAVGNDHAKASMIARLDGAKREPRLADEYEGIPLQMKNGTVTIVPGRGQLFRIIGEAESYEMASELCDEAIKILKNES